MAEIRNRAEGALYWIQASGSGASWVTASAASGVLMGYVRDFSITPSRNITTVKDRGIRQHHKFVDDGDIQVSFQVAAGITAQYPPHTVTGSGASVPMIHMEFRQTAPEQGKSIYYQLHGVALTTLGTFTEGDNENTKQWQGMALGMNGPTGSGYIG